MHCQFTGKNCPSLPTPVDGSVRFTDGQNNNSEATFSCNEGFTLVQGERLRVCRVNRAKVAGVWDGQSPKCIGKFHSHIYGKFDLPKGCNALKRKLKYYLFICNP